MKSGAHGQQDVATVNMQDETYSAPDSAGDIEYLTAEARMPLSASIYAPGDWQLTMGGRPVTREDLTRDGWELRSMGPRQGYMEAVFTRQRRG
jgi:hypothetical protein